MNIVIVGQGAMGLLWHHHFQQLNQPNLTVTLLPSKQGSSNQDTSEQGTLNQSTSKIYSFTNILGYSQQGHYVIAKEIDIRNAGVLLLCVKSYQVKVVLAQIGHLLAKKTLIILAHNGMGTLLDIADDLRVKHHFLTLLTTHGCARPNSKHIIHTGLGESDLGILNGQLAQTQIQSLTTLFNQALPNTYWHQNIAEKQWQKLAVNCVINPLTALNNVNNGEINREQFTTLKIQIIAELVLVAQAEKQPLAAQTLLNTVNQVALATANNCSSMRADILAKRTTEIDHINGYIHRLGIKHQIATPANSKLLQQIKALNI